MKIMTSTSTMSPLATHDRRLSSGKLVDGSARSRLPPPKSSQQHCRRRRLPCLSGRAPRPNLLSSSRVSYNLNELSQIKDLFGDHSGEYFGQSPPEEMILRESSQPLKSEWTASTNFKLQIAAEKSALNTSWLTIPFHQALDSNCTTQSYLMPEMNPRYVIGPKEDVIGNYYRKSSLEKYFQTPSNIEDSMKKSPVIRKLFPERVKKKNNQQKTVHRINNTQLCANTVVSCDKFSLLSNELKSVREKSSMKPFKPKSARRLDATKKSTYNYFMSKLSLVSNSSDDSTMQVSLTKEEEEDEKPRALKDDVAIVFKKDFKNKMMNIRRNVFYKTEKMTQSQNPTWKY